VLPGDTGTVVAQQIPSTAEEPPLYRVRMNRTTAGMHATFNADELEPRRVLLDARDQQSSAKALTHSSTFFGCRLEAPAEAAGEREPGSWPQAEVQRRPAALGTEAFGSIYRVSRTANISSLCGPTVQLPLLHFGVSTKFGGRGNNIVT
jgi:hypothetical protein